MTFFYIFLSFLWEEETLLLLSYIELHSAHYFYFNLSTTACMTFWFVRKTFALGAVK